MKNPTFSIIYPTRHRPEFIRQALKILGKQDHDSFEVIVCDNPLDEAETCESICRDIAVPGVRYIRPPRPLGMVANWEYAHAFATGRYLCYLTDKTFLRPGALARIERAIELAGNPDIVSWTSDVWSPASYSNYFGGGRYWSVSEGNEAAGYQEYLPSVELDRRGQALVSRGEQSAADYARAKLVFGAYHRDLIAGVVKRYGALFHNINPDYTSMVLGLSEASTAVELRHSCVVSVNTDISNGMLSDTNDAAAFMYLESLEGGAQGTLEQMLIPGLYSSTHNWVAHDYLSLRSRFKLDFVFDFANWIAYCVEDVHRPGRRWSSPEAERSQKRIIESFKRSLDPQLSKRVAARLAERAATDSPRSVASFIHRLWQRLTPVRSPSLMSAIQAKRLA